MISTTFKFTVSGNSHEEILEETKNVLANFFESTPEEVDKKLNIDIEVTNYSLPEEYQDNSDDDYIAIITAKVRNV